MFRAKLGVGPLVYEIEIPVDDVPAFRDPWFTDFLVRPDAPADVHICYQMIPSEALTLPNTLPHSDIQKLNRCYFLGVETNMFRSPLVREHLQQAFDEPERFFLKFFNGGAQFFDYKTRTMSQYVTASTVDRLPNPFIIQEFLSFALTFSMLPMHSCAVQRDAGVALFLAPSGGGKSTLARLAPEGTVLSDDNNLLWLNDSEITVAPTPFSQVWNKTLRGTLRAVFVLQKASAFRIAPLERRDYLPAIWHGHRYYNYFLPKRLKLKAFDLYSSFMEDVPVFLLRFAREHIDWDAIDAAMRHTDSELP